MNRRRLQELITQDKLGPWDARSKEATCDGKEAFKSAALAHNVAKRRKRSKSAGAREAFRCPFCNQWHIGSK